MQALQDHKFKNPKLVIQRICTGQTGPENLKIRHPLSEAMARRPKRHHRPSEWANSGNQSHLLKSQINQ